MKDMNEIVGRVLKVLFFIVCIVLVVYGQRTVGKGYLLMQLIGLGGLLVLLWNYNRKYV